MHDTSCLTPPKGLVPPSSGPCLARFAAVPHPAIGGPQSNKTTQIVRKAISPPSGKSLRITTGHDQARPNDCSVGPFVHGLDASLLFAPNNASRM